MAQGDIHIFSKFVNNTALASLTSLWGTNTIKMGIITSAQTPSITATDPRWGAGGTENYSTSEVTPGGNYSAGGIALTGTTTTLAGAVTSLNATSPIAMTANNANPTNAYWGILYDSTDAGKHCFGFIELASAGVAVSTTGGITLHLAGAISGTQQVFTVTAT